MIILCLHDPSETNPEATKKKKKKKRERKEEVEQVEAHAKGRKSYKGGKEHKDPLLIQKVVVCL